MRNQPSNPTLDRRQLVVVSADCKVQMSLL